MPEKKREMQTQRSAA